MSTDIVPPAVDVPAGSIYLSEDVEAGFTLADATPLPFQILLPCQTHTANVAVASEPGLTFPDTDALISLTPGVAVGVRTADCVPILIFAPDIHAVAAVHAGWKGTLHGIAGNTVEMLRSLGAEPAGIRVAFAPHICPGCFETGEEVAALFAEAGFSSRLHPTPPADPLTGSPFPRVRPHIDLQGINTDIMLSHGVIEKNIQHTKLCTRHSRSKADGSFLFHSYRRENGTPERMISWIRMS